MSQGGAFVLWGEGDEYLVDANQDSLGLGEWGESRLRRSVGSVLLFLALRREFVWREEERLRRTKKGSTEKIANLVCVPLERLWIRGAFR